MRGLGKKYQKCFPIDQSEKVMSVEESGGMPELFNFPRISRIL
jgi:hypothetical protein